MARRVALALRVRNVLETITRSVMTTLIAAAALVRHHVGY